MRRLAMLALFAALPAFASDDKKQEEVPGPKVGDKAPLFAVRDIKGRMVFLKDLIGERASPRTKKTAIILDFFQTTCAPCKEELPLLLKVQKAWADKGVELVMVSYMEQIDVIQAFVEEQKLTNLVLTDPYGTAADLYKVTALPRTYLIDAAGNVRFRHAGKSASIDGDIEKVLKTLPVVSPPAAAK